MSAPMQCPVCARELEPRGLGSGLAASQCREHGAWLDHGTLAAMLRIRTEALERRRREWEEPLESRDPLDED